jgi:hypothetical protein
MFNSVSLNGIHQINSYIEKSKPEYDKATLKRIHNFKFRNKEKNIETTEADIEAFLKKERKPKLTPEERRENKKIANKKYYDNNKNKIEKSIAKDD